MADNFETLLAHAQRAERETLRAYESILTLVARVERMLDKSPEGKEAQTAPYFFKVIPPSNPQTEGTEKTQ